MGKWVLASVRPGLPWFDGVGVITVKNWQVDVASM